MSATPGYGTECAENGDRASHRLHFIADWWIWRTIGLRSAGFPVSVLDTLTDPALTSAADSLIDAEHDRERSLARAKAFASGRLKAGADRRDWRRALRLLQKNRVPDELPEEHNAAAIFQSARAALSAVAKAEASYRAAWTAAARQIDRSLRRHATDKRLREAVVWQNPDALDTAFDHLLRQPEPAADSATRQHALLVARYLQRYCAKNDTIGFFGPMAWANLTDDGPVATLRAGTDVIAGRETCFERWAIAALAQCLAPQLRIWLSPRMGPHLRLQGGTLIGPLGRVTVLSASDAGLLRACDGGFTAGAIARQLRGSDGFADESTVLARMEQLALAGVLLWDLIVPAYGRPEHWVREALQRVENAPLRERLLGILSGLEAGRARLHESAGDDGRVRASYTALARDFEARIGRPSTQRHGETYAGRTLVYHDCRRNVELELGPELMRELAAPLGLFLDSARWYATRLAGQFMDFLDGLFDDCCRKTGGGEVPFDMIWFGLHAAHDTVIAIANDVAEQVRERWAEIIVPASDARRLSLSSAALEARIATLFAAPGPAWPGARFHSPDILLAASSIEELRAGRYVAVLGEIHAVRNTLMQQLFLAAHPHPEEMTAAMAHDQRDPELIVIGSRPGGTYRFVYDPDSPINCHVELEKARSWLPRERVIHSGDLLVRRGAAGLELRPVDDTRRVPARAFLGPYMQNITAGPFSILAPARHTPRVTVDNLVVCRESWLFYADEMRFAGARDPGERYAGALRFARANDLPRWMFYRAAGEKKPVYLDWQSPPFVEMLAAAVRAARTTQGEVELTEMLPAPEQAWLTDAQGRRYTCELRMVAVDRRGPVPPPSPVPRHRE